MECAQPINTREYASSAPLYAVLLCSLVSSCDDELMTIRVMCSCSTPLKRGVLCRGVHVVLRSLEPHQLRLHQVTSRFGAGCRMYSIEVKSTTLPLPAADRLRHLSVFPFPYNSKC